MLKLELKLKPLQGFFFTPFSVRDIRELEKHNLMKAVLMLLFQPLSQHHWRGIPSSRVSNSPSPLHTPSRKSRDQRNKFDLKR